MFRFGGGAGVIPRNIRIGVSIEDQRTAEERIPALLRNWAGPNFVSYEPALGPVDLRGIWKHCPEHDFPGGFCIQDCGHWRRIDWLIRVGKKLAGRTLDGHEHNEMPAPSIRA